MFYICGEDLHLREIFARGDLPSRESVSKLLEEIFNSPNTALRENQTFQVSQLEQTKEYDIRVSLFFSIIEISKEELCIRTF